MNISFTSLIYGAVGSDAFHFQLIIVAMLMSYIIGQLAMGGRND